MQTQGLSQLSSFCCSRPSFAGNPNHCLIIFSNACIKVEYVFKFLSCQVDLFIYKKLFLSKIIYSTNLLWIQIPSSLCRRGQPQKAGRRPGKWADRKNWGNNYLHMFQSFISLEKCISGAPILCVYAGIHHRLNSPLKLFTSFKLRVMWKTSRTSAQLGLFSCKVTDEAAMVTAGWAPRSWEKVQIEFVAGVIVRFVNEE